MTLALLPLLLSLSLFLPCIRCICSRILRTALATLTISLSPSSEAAPSICDTTSHGVSHPTCPLRTTPQDVPHKAQRRHPVCPHRSLLRILPRSEEGLGHRSSPRREQHRNYSQSGVDFQRMTLRGGVGPPHEQTFQRNGLSGGGSRPRRSSSQSNPMTANCCHRSTSPAFDAGSVLMMAI